MKPAEAIKSVTKHGTAFEYSVFVVKQGGLGMLQEVLKSASVRHVQGIMNARYGTGFKVDFLVSAKNIGSPLRIPIFSGDQFLAQALIDDPTKIPSNEIESVSNMIQLVLEPALKSWVSKNQLRSMELSRGSSSSKLYALKDEDQNSSSETRDFGTQCLFVETKSELGFRRMASEIHELSGRWAMLPMDQILDPQEFAIEELNGLGAITLLIQDLSQVTEEALRLIESYLAQGPTKDQPLLILSSSVSLEVLVSKSKISDSLSQQLSKNTLEADRFPQGRELLKQSLELFLEPHAMI